VDPEGPEVHEAEMASTMAAVFCMAVVDCGCKDRSHDTVPSCRHSENIGWEDVRTRALEIGLVYDGACLRQQVEAIEAVGCELEAGDDFGSILGVGICAAYHGDRALGEECTDVGGGISDCAQGLACWNEECVDPCAASEHGGRGRPFGFACAPVQRRKPAGLCADPAQLGEECDSIGCVDGLFCDPELLQGDCCGLGMCGPLVSEGDSCLIDEGCDTAMCEGEVCVEGPVTGEPCLNDRCLGNIECIDGICGPPEPAICTLTP